VFLQCFVARVVIGFAPHFEQLLAARFKLCLERILRRHPKISGAAVIESRGTLRFILHVRGVHQRIKLTVPR
jgi:hypothetical protein